MGEIRDPIHVFVRFGPDEEKIIGSRAFQRLRHIHQLALTYLVYPGATHRRFEHCLGVMEVASRIYDVVTDPQNIHHDSVREFIPRAKYDRRGHEYWRQVLRCAALCHDLGHLPFSHAAEKDLLPDGWDHERLSQEIIVGRELQPLWKELKIQGEDVAKLALGPKKCKLEFSDWEAILSELIVGDVFGADRIDYLLRDSYHAGVSYGRFDHYRLIDTLRILPVSRDSLEPALGIERGGLESAEALLWARYFMYTQLYFHPTRRIYDMHLMEFLREWLPGGRFSTDIDQHIGLTDNEVTAGMWKAATDPAQKGHVQAKRIVSREHFRQVYEPNSSEQESALEPGRSVYDALAAEFGGDHVRRDVYAQKGGSYDFPVYTKSGDIDSSLALSRTLSQVPTFSVDRVYVSMTARDEAELWVDQNRQRTITGARREEPPHATA